MTPERDRLLDEIAALRRADELAPGTRSIPDAIAERVAELAKLDAEPDWGPAVERFADAAGFECGNLPEVLESIRVGLIAAAPLFPRDAGMSEEEIERLARESVKACTTYPSNGLVRVWPEEVATYAIRETLKRAPQVRWPSDSELLNMAINKDGTGYVDCFTMARRLKAHLTGEGAKTVEPLPNTFAGGTTWRTGSDEQGEGK